MGRSSCAGTNPAIEQLGEHGYRLLAAETATAAGHAHRRDGRINRARRSTEPAAALRTGCQDARTPLLDLDGLGTVLTPRERQAAILAADLSSREIATRRASPPYRRQPSRPRLPHAHLAVGTADHSDPRL